MGFKIPSSRLYHERLEATKDALDTLTGNYSPDYSPRVIPDPTFNFGARDRRP
jgi:hypothetical protein